LRWYTNGCGGTLVGSGTPLVLAKPTSTTTYFARWETADCGNSSCANVTVTVNQAYVAPTSAASDVNNFCSDAGGNISLSATGGSGTNLRWYTSSCGGTLVGSGTPLVLAKPTVTTTYFARWETTSCGNSSCVSTTVTVIPAPVAPTSAASDVNNFCSDAGGIISLSATGGSGTTLKWYTSSCGGTLVGSGTPLVLAKPTVTTTYFARWETAGCSSSSCASVVVTVIPAPIAPTAAASDINSFCLGASGNISLSATGGSGTTLRWYTSSCGGTLVGSGTPLVLAKPIVTTTYFARWETMGCASSSCASVTVTVGGAPTFTTCPAAPLAVFTAGNSCSALVSYAVAASGIPTPNLSYQFTNATIANGIGTGSSSSFSKGITNVVITAQNNCGTSFCSFSVSVTDNENPVIVCPSNIVRSTDLNQCTAIVNYVAPTATDNCPGVGTAIIAPSLASGLSFPIGASTVIWGATDAAGNTKTCTFIVTVTDAQKPTITCPANKTQATDPDLCSAVVTYTTPTATDNCTSNVTLMFVSGSTGTVQGAPNSSATFNKGANTVTWKATDATGNTQTCSFRVTVNDLQQPTMTCPPPISLSTATNLCNAVATYTNPSFTDNCTPTSGTATRISGLVSGATFPIGNSNVVFQATDAAGNTRRCTMVITVADNQPPVVSCPPSVVVDGTGSPCRATVFYSNATASDNCAGSLTAFLVTGLASGSAFPAGVTTNTFRAVAPNGQSSECTFSVTVNCGNGMGNTGTEVRDADLGIPQNSNLDLAITPNPALSSVTVSIEGVGEGGGTLLVFDAVGRLVLRQLIAENQHTAVFQVDDSAFSPGLYRVNLRATNGTVTKTLVVVKQ
jgi:HYR domain/Ig-like domain CHU_C associated